MIPPYKTAPWPIPASGRARTNQYAPCLSSPFVRLSRFDAAVKGGLARRNKLYLYGGDYLTYNALMSQDLDSTPPVILVPGLRNSGPGHWQTLWEAQRGDCTRAQLGDWDQPHRNAWVSNLGLAIRQAGRPVVLAAHSLGCHTVAWWAALEPEAATLVRGALLVAPPEVDFFPLDDRLSSFAPTVSVTLPFPAILVGSRNDPYMGLHGAQQLARRWDARFVDLGLRGHINADSGLGDWPLGQAFLRELMGEASETTATPRHTQSGASA